MLRRKDDTLLFETMFAGVYQIEKTMEYSTYSALLEGKNKSTGKAVLVRRWFPAYVTTAEEQVHIHEEIAILQAVQHPHLLPILEVSTTGENVFLVSMAVPGETLGTRLGRYFPEPLPLAEALSIIAQVGQALHALHQSGRCHGNLTPQAIFFSETDQVFLGECRLKSVLECIPNYQPALEEGIPLCWYMAPEQFSGVFNATTDQYGLGGLAYHLLTGRVPFSGSARATLFQKHVHDQPRALRELNPAIPAQVEEAVLKALAKQAAERHNSIQAFLEALDQPSRGTIADQNTTANLALDVFALEASRRAVPELGTFHLSHALASVTGILNTIKKSAPATTLARVLADERKRLSLSPRRREFAVLGLAIVLVLILVLTAGGWLLASSHHAPQTVKGIPISVPSASPALTPGTTQVPAIVSPTPGLSLSPTPRPSAAPAVSAITPFLDCVTTMGSNFLAEFGYRNPNAVTLTIPRGGANLISPSSADGAQPTSFAPGVHHQVFQVRFFKHGTVTWTLNGSTVTVSSGSPRC